MSDAHAAPADGAKSPKSKKMLIIIVAAVVALAGAGGGWFLLRPKADPVEEETAHAKPAAPPTFLPIESLVVNLADPSGDRFAQIGITLEITDSHAADQVKAFMPAIRSGILLVVSQRTTTELLGLEGKQKLALDIKREVSRPLGYEDAEEQDEVEEKPAPKKGAKVKPEKKSIKKPENPISRVLFSSFIVQ